MGAKPFENFSANDVVGQINCGLNEISNPFVIEEPATLLKRMFKLMFLNILKVQILR